jgi:hypothetical protein
MGLKEAAVWDEVGVVGPDGERLEPMRRVVRRKAETAAEIAELRLRGQAVRATRALERVLKVGEAGGLTIEEYEQHPRYWEHVRRTAETTLKLILGARKGPAPGTGAGRETGKAGRSSATAEPEDDSGVPADLLSHLR